MVKLSCEKGFVAKCVKIRKKRKPKKIRSKIEYVRLIERLPLTEQRRLEKLNLELLKDQSLAKKRNEDVAETKAEVKAILVKGDKSEENIKALSKLQRKVKEKRVEKALGKTKLHTDIVEHLAKPMAQAGVGEAGDGGTADFELEQMMDKDPNFLGVISADEIPKLPLKKKLSFIINTDPRSKPGEHWTCCRIDATFDKSICFYDPFGEDPPSLFMKDIKSYVDEMKLPYMLKMKINQVKNQDVNTDTCGFHCVRFLEAMNRGESFAKATGYQKQDNSSAMESVVAKLKKQKGFGAFGHI